MKNNAIQELSYCTTRQIVTTTRGEQLPIKQHNGWQYVNYKGTKIGLSKIAIKHEDDDFVHDYIFNYGHSQHPCHAINYLILRHRMKQKITPTQYKQQYF